MDERRTVKTLLRKVVKEKIALLSSSQKQKECEPPPLLDLPLINTNISKARSLFLQLCKEPLFTSSRGVAVYLSMPSEVDTQSIIHHILTSGK